MKKGKHEAGLSLKKYRGSHEAAPAVMAKIRPAVSVFMAVLLCVAMPISAFADFWDLTQGSIEISMQDQLQYVSQGGAEGVKDSAPIIHSNNETTGNTISVSGEGVQFTIQDVSISTTQNTSAINIADGSSVEMTVSGSNNVDTVKSGSTGNAATVHVGNAELTIKGDEGTAAADTLNVNENGQYQASNGAGIGSNVNEDFAGTVNISGDVTVNAGGTYKGAALGSGSGGDFSGKLNVTDGAALSADSANNAAAIGGGQSGEFSGEINIIDSSVTATSYNNGAGIGGGFNGDFSGSLNIENSDVFARAGNISGSSFKGEAAGIGGGYNGDFTGSISITDSTVEAVALHDGAGIGAGGTDSSSGSATAFTGELSIENSNVTAVTGDRGTPIGAPESSDKPGSYTDGEFSGSVSVSGDSVLNLVDGMNTEEGTEPLIGGAVVSEEAKVTVEDSTRINEWSGEMDKSNISDGDRNSYQQAMEGGSYKELPMTSEALANAFSGAELELIVVPKPVKSGLPVFAEDMFWHNAAAQIRGAQKGDTVTLEMGSRTHMPVHILELAKECQVTLIIKWDGGEDIEILPDRDFGSALEGVEFIALAELAK